MNKLLKIAVEAALLAGKEIMHIYARDFEVEYKEDASPLTEADQAANTVIVNLLNQTPIPIISEENKQLPYSERTGWERCWIVDPLDGTKEFIKKNDEFTVNIALVSQGAPVMGVILVPAENLLYYAIVEEGKAYRVAVEADSTPETLFAKATPIAPQSVPGKIRVVGSRSHMNEATLDFVEQMKNKGKEIEIVSRGSSLKLCLIAEGAADVYPRFAPTMEWDTAAGHAICKAVGVRVQDRTTGNEMRYNKENLLNNHFLVSHE
ncbi:3'(2'),5'-bisphosphate nucleotidase CysQ [Planktosalinus lacus]|uniref:3'(2'),5'-bisphosphate nucleotidase CysQ n=1 Tax=Planktosalinus lacus TaxID=1526573 RepID=A0A8J2Y954_9FLAO|nr:3'(2'),5'-bisphosphate nucleotidase CysQ [Planktosalinus lacus]GGD85014.1 3'(2'),5'-bisphosphate nucleotidase CysQ [Planktosalinus lacus]